MNKLYFLLSLFIATTCFSQTEQKVTTFISLQANRTLYDESFSPRFRIIKGVTGTGLQSFIHTKTHLKPTVELIADLFRVPRYGPADEPMGRRSIVYPGIYAGPFFQPNEQVFIATTVGTSIFERKARFGLRPSVGFYPTKRKNWMVKASFTNIFLKPEVFKKQDFGYVSLALAFRM